MSPLDSLRERLELRARASRALGREQPRQEQIEPRQRTRERLVQERHRLEGDERRIVTPVLKSARSGASPGLATCSSVHAPLFIPCATRIVPFPSPVSAVPFPLAAAPSTGINIPVRHRRLGGPRIDRRATLLRARPTSCARRCASAPTDRQPRAPERRSCPARHARAVALVPTTVDAEDGGGLRVRL